MASAQLNSNQPQSTAPSNTTNSFSETAPGSSDPIVDTISEPVQVESQQADDEINQMICTTSATTDRPSPMDVDRWTETESHAQSSNLNTQPPDISISPSVVSIENLGIEPGECVSVFIFLS